MCVPRICTALTLTAFHILRLFFCVLATLFCYTPFEICVHLYTMCVGMYFEYKFEPKSNCKWANFLAISSRLSHFVNNWAQHADFIWFFHERYTIICYSNVYLTHSPCVHDPKQSIFHEHEHPTFFAQPPHQCLFPFRV